MECEYEQDSDDRCDEPSCLADRTINDPDAILAALAEAGVLKVEWGIIALTRRFVSPWKEAK
jgi:hypothetical protein